MNKELVSDLGVSDVQTLLDAAVLDVLRNMGDKSQHVVSMPADMDESGILLGVKRSSKGVYTVVARLVGGNTASHQSRDLGKALAAVTADELMPSRRSRLKAMVESAVEGMDSDECDSLEEELLQDGDMEVYVHPARVMDDDELLLVHGSVRKAKGVWPFIVQVARRDAKHAADAVLELYDKEVARRDTKHAAGAVLEPYDKEFK